MNRLTAYQQAMAKILKSFFAVSGISPKKGSVIFYENAKDKDFLYTRDRILNVRDIVQHFRMCRKMFINHFENEKFIVLIAANRITGKVTVSPLLYNVTDNVEIVDLHYKKEFNSVERNILVVTFKLTTESDEVFFCVFRIHIENLTSQYKICDDTFFNASELGLEKAREAARLEALSCRYETGRFLENDFSLWQRSDPRRTNIVLTTDNLVDIRYTFVQRETGYLPGSLNGSYKITGSDSTQVDMGLTKQKLDGSAGELYKAFTNLMEVTTDAERAVLGLKKFEMSYDDFCKKGHPLIKKTVGFNVVRVKVNLNISLGNTNKETSTYYRRFTYLIHIKDNKYKLFVKTQKTVLGLNKTWEAANPESSFISEVEASVDSRGRHTVVLTQDLFKDNKIFFQILEGDDKRLKKEITVYNHMLVWNKYSNVKFLFQLANEGYGLYNDLAQFYYRSDIYPSTEENRIKSLSDWLGYFMEAPSERKITELLLLKSISKNSFGPNISKLPYHGDKFKKWLAEGIEKFPIEEPCDFSSEEQPVQLDRKVKLKLPNLFPGVKNIYVKDNDIYFTIEEGKSENTHYRPGGKHARFYLRPETDFMIKNDSYTIVKITKSLRMAHEHSSGGTFCYGNYTQDFHDIIREVKEDRSKVWKLINMFVTSISFFGATETYGKYGLEAYKRLY